ncbi:symmetrical bis(5'-nucleosyl)-tetraphosphatase [Rheinheimera sp. MMS21-TC3]|uniref:symmetrical bis(5'-nucleosyl)-tetraphosphatase n=1 Tax=Rheinheimera sp. MMS21-TC3 TaxID=3072790 RepID=UPI0028C39947|nr:symmetrical bis(5'-nucleosyl)-tetraphosphatase [Rheinheimera sp. MMS21-TC3]WNO62145.1 symmetrical bis(5'-nucleosyl)-tetraphosphatase [Rheinheimera sp. MMS21-TC3]
MATYVIGDLQGCFEPLQRLLQQINFSTKDDTLWFCGDLIARGPQSLECLNFIYNLGSSAQVVLGNHDLHFIACYYGIAEVKAKDKLQPLLQANNLETLVHWLRYQPLMHVCQQRNAMMVHAGLAPDWQLTEALEMTQEVQTQLQQQPLNLLQNMYGNKPVRFADAKTKEQRWRYTINSCTRMRFCSKTGALDLKHKGHPNDQPDLVPWYEFCRNKVLPQLFFGHWAALNGFSPVDNVFALDTGCVWGNSLTAYCIDSQKRFSVAATVL